MLALRAVRVQRVWVIAFRTGADRFQPAGYAWVATMRHRVVDLVASHPYWTASLITRLTLTLGRSSPVVGRSSRGPVGGRSYAVLGQSRP